MVMRCVHPRPWLLPHPHWGTFVMHRSCRVYLAMPDLDRRHAGCAGRHPSCIALGASPVPLIPPCMAVYTNIGISVLLCG